MKFRTEIKRELVTDVVAGGGTAGVFAAISSKQNVEVKNVSYKELCDALKNIGAIVPENK